MEVENKIFLDIETNDLKADIGQLTAIGIIKNGNVEIKFVGKPEDEKETLNWFRDKLKDCKLIITWNGDKFDIPFLLTRALILGVDLSELTKIKSLDLCKFCKEKFSFAKYSLAEVSYSLGIKKKDEISWKNISSLYLEALRGSENAKREIIKHCESDLLTLKEIFEKLKSYIPNNYSNNSRNT
jgi:uncharacterized protein YprB with RNaseH-like and TPR domain